MSSVRFCNLANDFSLATRLSIRLRMTAPEATSYVLAIDLGSSGPKVALFSDRCQLVAQTSRTTSTFLTPDGGGEQDPAEWWQSTTDAVRDLVGRRLVPVERIVAVSCASQWSVTVPVDRQGRHLMNAIHWTDSRGARTPAASPTG